MFLRFYVPDGLDLFRKMEDKRNIIRRRNGSYVKPDVPVVVDMVNIGTCPEQFWRTSTSPLHFRVSSQSLDDVLIGVTAAGKPPRIVGAVAL